jgi:enoyl-CoA hydratase
MNNLVSLRREGSIAWLALRRPEKLNALSPELLAQGVEALQTVANDDDVRVLILHGEGRAFSAGADLASMRGLNPSRAASRFSGTTMWQALEDLSQPTIAAVHGYCYGGGCELALACDFRLASEDARFGQPEIKVGIIPGAGGTQRLPRLVGMTKAKEMVFFGEPIDANEAYRVGLVNRVVPASQLLDEARQWGERLAKLPPLGLRAAKAAMNHGRDVDLANALAIERLSFAVTFGTEDQREGIQAFLEKRPPQFKGR